MPTFYFAYGSNMSPAQMQRRCPGAQFAGRAALRDWRLIIMRRGAANIVREPGALTHGVLWRFENRHIGLMDLWEGIAHRVYRRIWLQVERPGSGRHGAASPESEAATAMTYVCADRWPGHPMPGYLETAMLTGAAAAGLPPDYHDELRSWRRRRPIGAAKPYRGRRTPKRPGRASSL